MFHGENVPWILRPLRPPPDENAALAIAVKCNDRMSRNAKRGSTQKSCGPLALFSRSRNRVSPQYESELMTSPPAIVESDCQTPLPLAENGKQGAVVLLLLRVILGGL